MGPDDDSPIDQECVEAYIFSGRPPRLLVLRRPPDRGSIWVPVSGKVDPTDADFPSALAREVNEETGFHDVLRTIDRRAAPGDFTRTESRFLPRRLRP
ncbi:MAG: NUDIX domain-containing protein [Thermoplasmata archaeon]|nr:NUDIX domain-containing protein [Thermoplasmata archaeon]